MIEFSDGFDKIAAADITVNWDTASTNPNSVQTGRYGGQCIRSGSNGAIKTVSALATRVIHLAFRCSAQGNRVICAFRDSGTNQCDLRLTSAGALQVTRNATVLATASGFTFVINTWYYFSFKATIDPSAGVYEVKEWILNGGNTLVSGTGANTRATANSSANQIYVDYSITSTDIDDVVVCNTTSPNNDHLGECRVIGDVPTGDGANTGWTPSTGTSHFGTVDETGQNSDTDYNSSATVGAIDTYTFPTFSTSGQILAVAAKMVARKDDAGTRQIVAETRSGGTNRDGATTQTMGSTYVGYAEYYNTNPATSAAWDATGVNNTEIGQKVIA